MIHGVQPATQATDARRRKQYDRQQGVDMANIGVTARDLHFGIRWRNGPATFAWLKE